MAPWNSQRWLDGLRSPTSQWARHWWSALCLPSRAMPPSLATLRVKDDVRWVLPAFQNTLIQRGGFFFGRRYIWELLQGRQPGNVWPLLFWPQHNNHISLGVFCHARGKWRLLSRQPTNLTPHIKLRKVAFWEKLKQPCDQMQPPGFLFQEVVMLAE